MFDDPTKLIGLIVGLFALLGIIAAVIVFLKGSVADGTIASLERSNAAYETELKAQKIEFEGKLRDKESALADLDKRVAAYALKGQEQDKTIEILKNVVTNADEVKAINELLGEHHDASMEMLRALESNVKKLIIEEGDRHGDIDDV